MLMTLESYSLHMICKLLKHVTKAMGKAGSPFVLDVGTAKSQDITRKHKVSLALGMDKGV